jgi:hypothetical protein
MPHPELPNQPFQFLGIDPTATKELIRGAAALVGASHVASTETLEAVAEALCDPQRRLPYELAYPFGLSSEQLADWRQLVSADTELEALFEFAEQLSPLNQANFFAEAAAHGAAAPELLCGFIRAHIKVEVMEVYDQVRDARRLAGFPPPSLAEMSRALDDLFDLQCKRLISAYSQTREAAAAIDACAEMLFEDGNQQCIGALGRLTAAYADASIDLRASTLATVEFDCDQIEEEEGAKPVEDLAEALDRWLELSRPIFQLGKILGVEGLESLTPLNRLRYLIIDLALNARYEQSIEVAALGQDKLSLLPNAVELLDQAAIPARQAVRTQQARAIANERMAAVTRKRKSRKSALQAGGYLAGAAIILGAGVFAFRPWSPSAIGASPQAPTASAPTLGDEEIAPAVGTQQRLSLANLRYCRFQEERLRLVKPKAKTPGQIRAFNLLVVDYNSRCSDILFRHDDDAIVRIDIARNQQQLAAEAEQILAQATAIGQ